VDAATIAQLREAFAGELSRASSIKDLQTVRDRYLGRKNGLVPALWSGIATAAPEVKRDLGRLANELKAHIESELTARKAALETTRPIRPRVDLSLPGRAPAIGHRHPLNVVRDRVEAIFARMGYEILDGPETEDDYHNFEALHMPADHPARDMQDTLYLEAPLTRQVWPVGADRAELARADRPEDTQPATLLRTHTSGMQIRYMERHAPPLRVIAPGRVYRRDNFDLTHTPMFQQVEGLVVDEDVTMADLKGTLIGFLRELFDPNRKVQFRPSFFPYTEPSADVFISCHACKGAGCGMCKRTGWIEILGCGMVHPAVFEAVGYDPQRYTGFAFGVGIERLAMLMYGVDDIRLFYENDLRFLEQFPL
jgi:phenylalanyl-tRNA synthetase alpha chain